MLRVAGDENTRQCSGDRKLLRLRQRRVVRSLCDLPRRHRQRRGEDEMTELHTGKTFLLEDGMTCRERKRSVSITDIPSVTKLVALQGDNSPARPRHPRHDAITSSAEINPRMHGAQDRVERQCVLSRSRCQLMTELLRAPNGIPLACAIVHADHATSGRQVQRYGSLFAEAQPAEKSRGCRSGCKPGSQAVSVI